MSGADDADAWRSFKELDVSAGASKGTAFRAFKQREPSWTEGTDFLLLDHAADAARIAALRAAGRIYESSRNVVLIAARHAETLLAPAAGGFKLEEIDGRLCLRALHKPDYGAICADWQSPEMKRRIRGGRSQLLARAAGLHKNPAPKLLDATAGLGRDGWLLAALGAQVTLAERCAPVAALLRDALRRSAGDPAAVRVAIRESDAREEIARGDWDVILLDPMYPHGDRSALAKKEMQFLRELTGGDLDADALLPPAIAAARERVAVKRPDKAPPLAGLRPDYCVEGTQARFDVYRGRRKLSP